MVWGRHWTAEYWVVGSIFIAVVVVVWGRHWTAEYWSGGVTGPLSTGLWVRPRPVSWTLACSDNWLAQFNLTDVHKGGLKHRYLHFFHLGEIQRENYIYLLSFVLITESSDVTGEQSSDSPVGRTSTTTYGESYEYGTAFSRIDQSNVTPMRDSNNMAPTYITSPVTSQNTSLSPMKYPIPHGTSLDHHHYFTHIGLSNSYADLSNTGNVLHNPRTFSEPHVHTNAFASAALGGSTLNMGVPTGPPPYWNGTTSTYPDSYQGYHCYGKYPNAYDGYGCSAALLRVTPDAYHSRPAFDPTKSAFDPTRSYYARSQDNYNGTYFLEMYQILI